MREKLNKFDQSKIIEIDKDPLKRESDRGCVLICASDLENELTSILKDWFKNAGKITKKEEENIFDSTGPLGTFSSKIYLSKAIGLLGAELHSDIQKVRKIRNMAAHNSADFSLSNIDVKNIVNSMHFNHDKTKRLQRYALYNSDDSRNEELNKDDMNESIMKGYGLLRYDKINFILSVRLIEFEISAIKIISTFLGITIRHTRDIELAKLKDKLSEHHSLEPKNADKSTKK